MRVDDRVLATLGPGDYFGEMALIDDGARSADIVADTELRCYCMTAWSFRPFVRNHPDLAWALLEAMVGRVREAQARPSSRPPRASPRARAAAPGPPRSPPAGGW